VAEESATYLNFTWIVWKENF